MIILPPRTSLSDVIGQGLSDLAGAYGEHQTSLKALKGLGFNDAEARAYAALGPQIQQQAIHTKQQQQAQEAANAAISQILGTGLNPAQQTQPYQFSPQIQQSPAMPQQQAAIQQATSIAQNPSFRKLNEQQQQAQALQQQQLAQHTPTPQAIPRTGEQQAILQAQAQQAPRRPTYEDKIDQINRQRQALSAMPLNPTDRFRAEALLNSAEDRALKEEQHRQKIEDKREERKEKREDTLRKDLESISKRAERAQQDNHSLQQIKAANDSGTLIQGPKRKLLENIGEKYGLDLQDYFTNTSTQYAAKTIQRMQTGAGTAFGTGRLTNFIADAYAQGLPRLANTQEGMDLIIKNVMLENKGHIALNDEIRKIKAEYRKADKIIPTDIEDMARERIEPKLDKYAEESLNNINAAVARQEARSAGKLKDFNKPPKATDFPEGAIMTDNKTGKRFIMKNGAWVGA